MGLEIGWYLRFARQDEVEALLGPKGLPQVRHQLKILPEWSLESEDRGDHTYVRLTRNTEPADEDR